MLQRLTSRPLLVAVAFACFLTSCTTAQEWEGFKRAEFEVGGRKAFLIVPAEAAAGKPWIWRTEFFGHEPQADLALLKHGFHVAYIDIQNLYGGPPAMEAMDAMHAHVTQHFGLSQKTVLEGFSRGGLFSLNWAARHPEFVACIYNDAPVCDFKSWPGGKGRSPGSKGDWERCLRVYGLTEEQAMEWKGNPVDNLEPLAKGKIPILHVCGATDDVVPIEENSLIVRDRYVALGGPFTLISKPHCNHHPHSLKDPTRIVNFVLEQTGFADRVTKPNTPFGYDYFLLRGGLQKSRHAFESKKTGRVAFLGGSITAGPGWRDHVCEELKRRFPETQFEFINAAIPSLGSTPGAFRFARDVLSKGPVDLLFEEAAVNDDTNGFNDVEQVRGMEGIVRHALLSNPQMDIVLLHFADPGKLADYRAGETPGVIRNHERVAEHYGTPSIDLAKELTERIEAGEFSWEKDIRDLHPSPFGHKVYADAVARLFDAAWDPSNTAVAQTSGPLPAPLDPASYFNGVLLGASQAVNQKQADLKSGWTLEDAWKPTDGAGTRAGFVDVPALVATSPGSTLELKFSGRGIGVFVASGPDTGLLEFRTDAGEWKSCPLFTQWSPSLHLPWAVMLESELPEGDHVVELRVADSKDDRSKGHALRIIHFLVNGTSQSSRPE